jgi:hypothetical protein
MATWRDVCELGLALPETEKSTSYRRPALKVAGKTVVRVDEGEKPFLL